MDEQYDSSWSLEYISSGDEEDLFITIEPSSLFTEELRVAAVKEFGKDGAWLLLSILFYGWRTYYDLARGLMEASTPPVERSDLRPFDEEYQIVKDLHVHSLLYSAAEQFAGLVHAARVYESDTSSDESGLPSFFKAYVAHKNVNDLIFSIQNLEMDELEGLIGIPHSLEEHPAFQPGIPNEEISNLFNDARNLAENILINIQELKDLVESSDPKAQPNRQPPREMDNAFRHGHRVFFHSAVPEQRTFKVVKFDNEELSHPVLLYMPRGEDSIHYAGVFCSPSRTEGNLQVIRMICLHIGRFVRGFVGWKALGTRDFFAKAVYLGLGEKRDDS